jgi:putative ABC transport system permease protein
MKLSRNLALSCELLAAHRLRTLLSILGIVVGVAAVVLMVSAGRGAEKRILDRIRDMGTDLIVVNAGQTRLIAGRQRQMASVTTLVPGDAEAIRQNCPSVVSAAAAVSRKLATRYEAETANSNVVGIDAEGFRIRNIEVASGRSFDAEEARGNRRVAVLGPTASRNLFGNAAPIGLRFRIGRVPFEVIGVARPKGMDANGADQDDIVLVPLNTAMRRLHNIAHVDTIYAQARQSGMLNSAEGEIRGLLRERHRLRDKPDDFTIQNQATLLETERETSGSMTLLIGSVAGISLLVGGVGILAVMLISIRERTHEIGLRRAVGATRRDIRNQFLLEAAILAGAGGFLGVLLGVSGAWGVSGLGYWEAVISWSSAVIGFAFSASLGVAFGIYPAIRAARLEPVDALRAE